MENKITCRFNIGDSDAVVENCSKCGHYNWKFLTTNKDDKDSSYKYKCNNCGNISAVVYA